MHLYRPTYTRAIPPHAVRVMIKQVEYVRWTARGGRRITAEISRTNPARCVVEVDCWWCEYKDHEGQRQYEECFPGRQASEDKMREIRDRLRKIKSGEISPSQVRRADRTLPQMITEWGESQAAQDTSGKQVTQNLFRVNKLRAALGATKIVDFTGHAVTRELKRMRDAQKRFSPQTSNHYLTAVKAFVNWCLRRGFIEIDPMRDAEPVECDSRRTFERRAMTPEEFGKLLNATRKNEVGQCPLSCLDRVALYATAAFTGFRVNELAHLTRASFQLDGDQPAITLAGRWTKNKKPDVHPIPADVANLLREWLASTPPTSPIWPGYAWRNGKVVRILRNDLAAAKVPEETEAGVIDFHALRTYYITSLAKAGVPIQHAQILARHASPTTTTKHYTRIGISDLGREVAKLPAIPPVEPRTACVESCVGDPKTSEDSRRSAAASES